MKAKADSALLHQAGVEKRHPGPCPDRNNLSTDAELLEVLSGLFQALAGPAFQGMEQCPMATSAAIHAPSASPGTWQQS